MIFRHQGRNRYLSIFPPHHLRTTLPALQPKTTVRKPKHHVRTPQRRRRKRAPQRSMHNLVCTVYHRLYLRPLIPSPIQANQQKTTATPTRPNTAARAVQPAPAPSPARAATNSGPNAPACATRPRTYGAMSSRRRRRSIAISTSSRGLRGRWSEQIAMRKIGGCILIGIMLRVGERRMVVVVVGKRERGGIMRVGWSKVKLGFCAAHRMGRLVLCEPRGG